MFRRLSASLVLLLFAASVGAPWAAAVSAEPPHACCVRKAHHCHSMASAPADQPTVRAPRACQGDCCKSLTRTNVAERAAAEPAFARGTLTGRVAPAAIRIVASSLHSQRQSRAPPRSC